MPPTIPYHNNTGSIKNGRMLACTGCANKKKQNPQEKSCIKHWLHGFGPNFQTMYVNFHTTYSANFVETTDMVQEIQQFEL